MVMKRLSEYLFFWTLGGTLYYSFEMIFRGFSHWSMVQRFCDYGGIYYRDFSQQSDALARMGLQ